MAGSRLNINRIVTDAEAHNDLELRAPGKNLVAQGAEIRVEHPVGVVPQFDQFGDALALARHKLRTDGLNRLPFDFHVG